jgi:thiol-disulfide isomerase/thioredoxin
MKMYPLLFILIITASFTAPFAKGYKIIGKVAGFADSTKLYLDDLTDGSFKHLDSTYIIAEKFQFTGKINVKALRVAIRAADINYRAYFWLENETIYFTAQKEKFREAVIEGSKTQYEANKFFSQIEDAKNRQEREYLYVRDNPSSIVSAYILSVYNSTWGKDTSEALYKNFSKDVKNTWYGKQTYDYIALFKNIKVGDKYADFSQHDINGKLRKLSEFKGKVVLLEFWGSWCGPCRKGNPELVKIYSEFREKGFEIFGVGAETKKEEWLDAVKEDGLTWTNVTDYKGDKNKAALIYGVSYYPTNFLIDKNGVVVARDLKGDKLREKLTELCR